MKLIIGLGNPGEKYEGTRHNVGFMVVDELARQMVNDKWQMVKKFSSSIINHQQSIIFCKPTTFMNSSGVAVSKLATYYKLRANDIWVIHDDLDIKLGEYKIQKGVGPKLHYGIRSIEESLGTLDFRRIRFGVDNRNENFSRKIPGERYVLENFTPQECDIVNDVINKTVEDLAALINK